MVNICAVDKVMKVTEGTEGDEREWEAVVPIEKKSVIGSLSFVDRFLSVWIISVMVIGVVVGYYSPVTQEGLSRIEGKQFS